MVSALGNGIDRYKEWFEAELVLQQETLDIEVSFGFLSKSIFWGRVPSKRANKLFLTGAFISGRLNVETSI